MNGPQQVKREAEFAPELVRNISEAVYRDRLGPGDAASMIEKDGAQKLRERAAAYDTLTRAYLRAVRDAA